MPRPKGSKNKAKAPDAERPKVKKAGKPAKEARKPAPAAAASEVGDTGQARKAITQNNLKSLMRSVASLKADADSTNGALREKIAYAVEHHYLDKEVFALIRRLDKKEPEKLLMFLENLEHYLDVSGLNDRADSVGKLPLEPEDEPEEVKAAADDDGPPTKILPADSEVSRPSVATTQAPGGTVHMLPDRKDAAA